MLTRCLEYDEVRNRNPQTSIKQAKVIDTPTMLILKRLKHRNTFYRSHGLKSTKSKHRIYLE